MQRAVAFLNFNEEVNARRTMQLVDDDAFSTVDDKLAATDHDRDFAEIDIIFFDFVFILAHEANANAERHSVGQSQCSAFICGVSSFRKIVADIFQTQIAVIAFDGKYFAQKSFEAFIFSFGDLYIFLEEAFVCIGLNMDKVWNRQGIAAFAVVTRFTLTHQFSF